MARPDRTSERPPPRGDERSPTAVERHPGVIRRWRERGAECRLARLLRPRKRRALARALRGTARDATERGSCLHSNVLLRYRAAAVRTDLLEIAALLEQAPDPDPGCVKEIHRLLTNGDSPLYHPGVHVSELYATLYYLRAGLLRDRASRLAPSPQIANDQRVQTGPTDAAAVTI